MFENIPHVIYKNMDPAVAGDSVLPMALRSGLMVVPFEYSTSFLTLDLLGLGQLHGSVYLPQYFFLYSCQWLILF